MVRERAQAAAKQERDRAHAAEVLATSSDLGELAAALRGYESLIDVEDCRAAWHRVLDEGLLRPTHEILRVRGRGLTGIRIDHSEPGRWRETGRSRVDAWFAPRAGIRHYPAYAEIDESWSTGFDVVVDRTGAIWKVEGRALTIHSYVTPVFGKKEQDVVLPYGLPFTTSSGRVSRGPAYVRCRTIHAGEMVWPHDAEFGYARALGVIFGSARTGGA